jgi:protein translocase SecG subunit
MLNPSTVSIAQIILGVLFILLVLLQSKGTGLGSTFGGEMAFYRTKRGTERIIFYLTCIIATLFLVVSVVRIVL